ncbi:uncharacterized protein TRIADDRAFT_57847 [Trichoplax adhaerens]|uniref:Uncharacterized protein n=1 Tax=Trichoplax adhaerens TaxID=10228 RepID=B3S1Q6_TRIAD|nr:hypothetical protein TRIADDRAFT_57847 [Trichoplax adhaerens]EDV23015.1 hypothetical protein TRIADDRAFT_57847 [Trichoplax adhaerens]|eukprot:XP_002113925.1 hypothetical protein TRIADDRAFT_57847 [Trichoplax adhaerens]
MCAVNTMKMLKDWDSGSKSTRAAILRSFIADMNDRTGPDLEAYFSDAASLFLVRLTAWLRMTQKFLIEFLEVGGVLTTLEILGAKATKEKDKSQALRLLIVISNYGRKYKEIICESFGVRAITECLAKSKSEETQENAKAVMLQLAEGNPRFQNQVYKAFIALMSSSSPKAQQLSVQGLKVVQQIVETANPNLVQPLINLLKSLHLEVQYEAPLPVHVQQAAAAKIIGVLSKESSEVSKDLLQLGVIHNLLIAAGNASHPDSQRQAGIALEHFINTYPIVKEYVMKALGRPFFTEFMERPDTIYSSMTSIQLDVLTSNNVDIPSALKYASR